MNIKCLIGLHSWVYTAAEYENFSYQRMAMPTREAERTCHICLKHQTRDEHCLGLNPPEYVYTWV